MAVKRGRGRPKKQPSRPDLVGKESQDGFEIDIRHNLNGVTISWLTTMFRMDRNTVRKRLAGCPEIRRGSGDTPVFDLAQAAAYLVKPKIDIREWVKSLRPADLPPYLQSEFWDAQNKRQKWEENAGDLWRTNAVIEAFADTFKLIKETMQQWTDNIERREGLTSEQRAILMQMNDGLQDELYQKLVEFSKKRKTPNQLDEMKDIEQAEHYREPTKQPRPELV
jgi:hypothetical protein